MDASHWRRTSPGSLSGYLEALSRPVFSTGMSWRVVDAKWDGIRDAFEGFDPERVAAFTPDDIDRLASDVRVIRNRRKIEATVQNAERIIELDREHGGFDRFLDSLGSFDETVAGLRREFRFLGETGAYIFLWSIDRPVPAHEDWMRQHGRRAA
jgi:DNA-3-methyladenine glycosylase I